ncbi:MAG: triacylglycerol lipase [Myxococcota bacterium]
MVERVLLVPGFLGFQRLGRLPYFVGVDEVLQRALAERGIDAQIETMQTLPTSSLRARARRLAERVAGLEPADAVHLVAHSTGGLDSRTMLSAHASLGEALDTEGASSRVRTVVSVCTPHHGTPLATFFVGAQGRRLLRLLSLMMVHGLRRARRPLSGLVRAGRILLWLDELIHVDRTILRQLYEELLDDVPPEVAVEIQRMLDHIGDDQSLIEQLGPAAIDILNAVTNDRPGVRYGCVVAGSPRPGLRTVLDVGREPYDQVTHAIYQALYRITARFPRRFVPALSPLQESKLTTIFGNSWSHEANDGFVPTLSQIHGELVHVARADHLDVMGYFRQPGDGRHVDWLASGSGFRRHHFEALWRSVARFIAAR